MTHSIIIGSRASRDTISRTFLPQPEVQTDNVITLLEAREPAIITSYKAAYRQPMERASDRLVASDWFSRVVVALKQKKSEQKKSSA